MNTISSHPLLLTFYGDDFTGSTDAMEALSARGVPAVLFLAPPTREDLGRFPEARAVGVAGISRGQSPEWMDGNLPPIFSALRDLGAPLCHYKICSTFDSSPTHGSIGRATELGKHVFQSGCVPILVGAPSLRRYVVFGNLSATVDGVTYRLDRHPTMSRHPVTPMDEADLLRLFARQSPLRSGLVDILSLQAKCGLERWDELRSEGADVIFFDTLDIQTLKEVGRAIWERRGVSPAFVVGSSGVEYALLAWWEAQGGLPPQPPVVEAHPVDRILVVSGSCSPVTAGQIRWALAHGFVGISVDPAGLVSDRQEYERLVEAATKALENGESPVIYSAAGPQDVIGNPTEGGTFGQQLGERLGALARELVIRCDVRRTVITGGDTSGHAGIALRIQALTMLGPIAPGGPLCRIWSADPLMDGREILLKGGQVGRPHFFDEVRQGKSSNLPK